MKKLRLLTAVLMTVIFFMSGGARSDSPAPEAHTVYRVLVDPTTDPVIGPAVAPVTVVFFFGYECPFSRKLWPTIAMLPKKYGNKVRVVLKHSPISYHANSLPAAKAAVCAQRQGRFERMHSGLMNGDVTLLTTEKYREFARKSGLKLPAFEACMADPATLARVNMDVKQAGIVGARGTPVTYVNGKKLSGARPPEELEALVTQELAAATKLIDEGTAPEAVYSSIVGRVKEAVVLDYTPSSIDVANAPRLGDPNAKIHIAMIADLQCPFSARAFPTMRALVDAHPGAITVTFHHYFSAEHELARPAAEAAVCANKRGQFWAFATQLFGDQAGMSTAIEQANALDSGCIRAPETAALVEHQFANAEAASVKGTPTFFIQGRRFNSPWGFNVEAFEWAIEDAYPGALR